MATLNARSLALLDGVHPDLKKIVLRCAKDSKIEFIVTEGKRTLERQKKLLAAGASRTLKSRHLPSADGKSRACDLAVMVGGKVRWDWPLYANLSRDMKAAAAAVGVPVEWGGDWKSLRDGPHYQLPWAKYP
jgi:peptidoglycan L-alanyl-D-glutamate endopeptidase CwlK